MAGTSDLDSFDGKKYFDLLEFAPDAFFHGDSDGNIILTNSKAIRMTGYSREELLSMNFSEMFTSSELNKKPLRYDLLREGKTILAEREIRHKSGKKITVEMNSRMNSDGTFQSFVRNITDRIIREKELEKARLIYEQSFKTNPDAVVVSDLSGTILEANQCFLDLLGYHLHEVIGKSSSEISLWSDLFLRECFISELIDKGQIQNFEANLFRKDGQKMTVLISASLIDIHGDIRVLSVGKDISSRKLMEIELEEAKKKAEESHELKSTFLSNLSHEIRTPMNGIVGFSDILKDENLSKKEAREYIDIINRSGIHLLRLINDIIEVSKIETNHITPYIEEVHLKRLFHDLKKQLGFAIFEKKNVCLEFENNNVDLLFTDEVKLTQILYNLVSNAFKFTNSGYVKVWSEYLHDDYVEFHVKDTGIGIPEKDSKLIFERFRQLEQSEINVNIGSGLGLSICKAYVNLLGGSISVESTEGKGSEFIFTIKNHVLSHHCNKSAIVDDHPVSDNLCGMSVLVVEDDDPNFELLRVLLDAIGCQFLRAKNGLEAVECVKDQLFDVILMDIKMPVMDGIQALREIRKNSNVPIVAQTAYAYYEDKKRLKDIGFNDFLSKPLKKEHLLTLLMQYK